MTCNDPDDRTFPDEEPNPDDVYDAEMQRRLDSGLCRFCGVHPVPDWGEMCNQCRTEEAEFMAEMNK